MRRAAAIVAMTAIAACSRGPGPGGGPSASGRRPPAPATRPAAGAAQGGTFDRQDLGVRLQWPAGWARQESKQYVLVLNPAGAPRQGGQPPSIALDVPNLPPHLPGVIPIGSVRNGYVDDLRKNEGALKTADQAAPSVPSANVRLVRSTWTNKQGEEWQETALLMVHADRVYILFARSRTDQEGSTRPAFDEVVRSLQWTTKSSGSKRP